jgi:ABC-type lipoprotein export system ATPase subunit
LADEPTGALDPVTAVNVRDLLIRCAKEQGAAVLIVTHDAELFRPAADYVLGFDICEQGNNVVSTLKQEGVKA